MTSWRPEPYLIRITWASLDAHQKPEFPVEENWFGAINNPAHSWPADNRKTRVECPLLSNGNYYLMISKKAFFCVWLDCFKAERGEMPLWNRLWQSYLSSKLGLLCFLHWNVFIKPQPALCCRLKWALDYDEALLPHDLQQGVLFYHGRISGDDFSLAQKRQWGLHMESACRLRMDQMALANRKEKLISIIKTEKGWLHWILYEWSNKKPDNHETPFLILTGLRL